MRMISTVCHTNSPHFLVQQAQTWQMLLNLLAHSLSRGVHSGARGHSSTAHAPSSTSVVPMVPVVAVVVAARTSAHAAGHASIAGNGTSASATSGVAGVGHLVLSGACTYSPNQQLTMQEATGVESSKRLER